MLRKFLSTNPLNLNGGLLFIRVAIGLSMLVFHGYDKLMGGPERWAAVGAHMGNLGINFAPVFWGFMAAFAEFACSILIILGAAFRPAVAILAFNMFVAVLRHLNLPAESPASGWGGASHALDLLIVYVGLILTGPGSYAFRLIGKKDLKEN